MLLNAPRPYASRRAHAPGQNPRCRRARAEVAAERAVRGGDGGREGGQRALESS